MDITDKAIRLKGPLAIEQILTQYRPQGVRDRYIAMAILGNVPKRVYTPVRGLFREFVVRDVGFVIRARLCPHVGKVQICDKCPEIANCKYGKERSWFTFVEAFPKIFYTLEAEVKTIDFEDKTLKEVAMPMYKKGSASPLSWEDLEKLTKEADDNKFVKLLREKVAQSKKGESHEASGRTQKDGREKKGRS